MAENQYRQAQFGAPSIPEELARVTLTDPAGFDGCLRLGVSAEGVGALELARALYSRCAIINPKSPIPLFNLGNVLVASGRFSLAATSFEHAIALGLDSVDAYLNSALTNLLTENYGLGWARYSRRWDLPSDKLAEFASSARLSIPYLDGVGFSCGRLLVSAEQGLGDQIMFASLLSEAAKLCRKLTLTADPRLVALFARSFPDLHVVDARTSLRPENFDRQISIGDLGGLFRSSIESFSNQPTRFLREDEVRRNEYRALLRRRSSQTIVGISWRSTNHQTGSTRSIPLITLLQLLAKNGLTPVCLQYGDPKEISREIELASRDSEVEVLTIPNLDCNEDIDGVAALVSACDMVITVGNTVGHLSGALGQNTHVLLPRPGARNHNAQIIPNWRWGIDTLHSRWYPKVTLHRQGKLGGWGVALEALSQCLANESMPTTALTGGV